MRLLVKRQTLLAIDFLKDAAKFLAFRCPELAGRVGVLKHCLHNDRKRHLPVFDSFDTLAIFLFHSASSRAPSRVSTPC